MKKISVTIIFLVALLGVSACSGGGQKSIDYNSFSQKFVDALFAGRFDDAKAMVGPEYSEDLSEDINQFSTIFAKYRFQEVKISTIRGWGMTNSETDKRVEVVWQYADKGQDNWAIGTLHIRIKSDGNTWGIADLLMVVPTE